MQGTFKKIMEAELREYGLSDKEAKVYLTCLKLGASTANRISSSTELRRSTTYDILESLKSKGLIGSFVKDKKLYFQASEPLELISLLRSKEEKIRAIIPQLEKIKATVAEKPKVELFEGIQGVTVLLEKLYAEKELLLYGSAHKASETLKHIPESLARRRVELGIELRAVFEHSKYATFRIEDPKIKKFTQMRFLDIMQAFPSVTFIAGDQVGILTVEKEIVGIRIVDKEISKTQKLIFENFWKQAEK
jgi:sugar-specific transcriptional regulator TrmB